MIQVEIGGHPSFPPNHHGLVGKRIIMSINNNNGLVGKRIIININNKEIQTWFFFVDHGVFPWYEIHPRFFVARGIFPWYLKNKVHITIK